MLYDVLIIGGGVVGALTARELSRYRLSVAVLEKEDDVAMGATKANSAIVHGGFDPIPGTLKAILNVRGTAMMEDLCRQLHVSYRKNGSLVLAFSEEEKEHLQLLYDRGVQNGVPSLSLIGKEELHALEPNVSDNAVAALRCESAGIVSPYELAVAAMGNAMDNGASLFCDFAVSRIDSDAQGFCVYDADGRAVQGRFLVNCAGLGADGVARLLGDESFTITPRRGEYLLFDNAVSDVVSHTIFQVPTAAGKGVLVTPTVHGNLLVGPTSDPQSDKNDKQTTRAGIEAVKAAASKSVADLPFRSGITSFAGLRAVPNCEDFIIRPMASDPRVIFAAGIESPGLSSAPAIATYVTELLSKSGLALEAKADFNPIRPSYHDFKDLSIEEKNEWIARDSTYGHIVCRCESVTEGEILAAIRRNPGARSLDAVKRRVRSGMGRCQGGFCAPFVTALLAKELGIDKTAVTKKGNGSYLLIGKTKEGN